MIPLDIIPTGWFHAGYSLEIAPGAVKPMRYFGQEMVAFRSASGELAVLDAFCHHLGAHLGYGGKVKGDCVECPYHGWRWNAEGQNTLIPYQDEPIKKPLKKWHAIEKHGIIFLWYDPAGGAPRWDVPDLFKSAQGLDASEDDFYPCYPHATVDTPNEPFPVQYMMENAADTAHFHFTHRTPQPPDLVEFGTQPEGWWKGVFGFRSPKDNQIAMTLCNLMPNPGLIFGAFNGKSAYRLVLAGTPVDKGVTHTRVSYFLPREKDSWDVMPEQVLQFAKSTVELYEEDARMWRHQRFMQKPVFATRDVSGYSSFRKWSEQFYEGAPSETAAS
jgi:3-ketosteroid 9alpha-monooxygenase subunit A